jgi:hypothetical protein
MKRKELNISFLYFIFTITANVFGLDESGICKTVKPKLKMLIE